MDRREFASRFGYFLGGAALLGLPGAYGGYTYGRDSGYDDGHGDGFREGKREGEPPSFLNEQIMDVSRDDTISPGSYAQLELNFDKQTHLRYAIFAEDYIDILVMNQSDFASYADGGEGEFMTMWSNLDTSRGVLGKTIPEGQYNIAIDNSAEYGAAEPSGGVDVSWSVTAYQK